MSHRSGWLDRRSTWQLVLIGWAAILGGPLIGSIAAAFWPGGHADRDSLIGFLCGPIIVSIAATVIVVWRRQRRADANTVAEWVESRRRPPR